MGQQVRGDGLQILLASTQWPGCHKGQIGNSQHAGAAASAAGAAALGFQLAQEGQRGRLGFGVQFAAQGQAAILKGFQRFMHTPRRMLQRHQGAGGAFVQRVQVQRPPQAFAGWIILLLLSQLPSVGQQGVGVGGVQRRLLALEPFLKLRSRPMKHAAQQRGTGVQKV
ncbi:hypothetical protein DEMA109039_12640 [Deinococcus marmoris]